VHSLVLVNVLIAIYQLTGDNIGHAPLVYRFGLIPEELT
jgi:hypothetical protein